MEGKEIDGAGRQRAIAAAVIGSALEWFNFTLFAVLAGTMAPLFFEDGDRVSALMKGFATIGAALLFRPIGGIVLGLYADRMGRKNALVVVFALMAASTLAIAALPTRDAVGTLAPTLLMLCLIVQAFSAGGEFANASVSLVEFAPASRRGLYGSLQLCSQALAILFGSIVALLLEGSLDDAEMEAWGWRVPFLMGSLLGPVGLYLRVKVPETPAFLAARQRDASRFPAPMTTSSRYWLITFAGMLVFAAVLGPSYANAKYLPQLVVSAYNITRQEALLTVICSALSMVALIPAMGLASDVFGRARIAMLGAVGMALLYPVLFAFFHFRPSLASLMLLQVGYTIPYAAVVGASATLVAEAFPIQSRATGTAIAYNIAAVAFGAGAPAAVAAFSFGFGQGVGPGAFMLAVSLLGLGGAAFLGRRKLRVAGIGGDDAPRLHVGS